MPQNKNFQKRITILDECFSSRSGVYTLEKLIQLLAEKLEVSVSRKTVQNDIKYIKEMIENEQGGHVDFHESPIFIPKLYDGKKTIYKYADVNLALGNQLLSKTDQEQLMETLAILSRYRNREDFFWLDELFPRIKEAFHLAHEDFNGLISYQSNRDYSGQSWVGKLYNQLLRKKVLIITYKGFQDTNSYLRKIHPYHLKQYNDRWFLFGFEDSERHTGITNLALDRIKEITETIDDIVPDTTIWGDFFDEMIGVSIPADKKPIEIKLRFSSDRIPYVTTKPIHGASQRLDKSDPTQRTIIINLLPNNEMYQTLLSFGSDVEVLSPTSVVDKMSAISQKMNEYYT